MKRPNLNVARRRLALACALLVGTTAPAQIVLDTFDLATVSGSVRPSTTWVGQVTQNATSITVGGTAKNDNGWGASSLDLDAAGMLFLNVTAQRDAGHGTKTLFLQFEDRAASTHTHVVSIDAALFAFGTPTLVQVPLGPFSSEFVVGSIGAWSIGGGGLGTLDFRMTLEHLELTASAIPEPTTGAALLGLIALGVARAKRRKVPAPSSRDSQGSDSSCVVYARTCGGASENNCA